MSVEIIYVGDPMCSWCWGFHPVLMAVTLIGAGAFVLANLIADIAYTLIDPRIRYR